MSDEPSGDWDAVTLAVSLVTARCWGNAAKLEPTQGVISAGQELAGISYLSGIALLGSSERKNCCGGTKSARLDRRAGVAVCGVVASDTSRRGVARGVLTRGRNQVCGNVG